MSVALRIRPQQSTQYGQLTERLAPRRCARARRRGARDAAAERLGGSRTSSRSSTGRSTARRRAVAARVRLGALRAASTGRCCVRSSPSSARTSRSRWRSAPLQGQDERRLQPPPAEPGALRGAFAGRSTSALRVLDPLCGGGTTCFLALAHGHDALGIDLRAATSTARHASRAATSRRSGSPFTEVKERTAAGTRWRFEAGTRDDRRLLALMRGRRARGGRAPARRPGRRARARDRRRPALRDPARRRGGALLREALPAWAELLLPGGAVALAWNATRLPRPRVDGAGARRRPRAARRRAVRGARAPGRPRHQAARRRRRGDRP